MARTKQIDIAERAFAVGTFGPSASGNLPGNVTQFVAELTPTPASWPASGDVIELRVEESPDAGTSWVFSGSCSWSGGLWHDKQGNVLPTATWVTTLMFTSGSRRLRLTANIVQACRAAASLSVQ